LELLEQRNKTAPLLTWRPFSKQQQCIDAVFSSTTYTHILTGGNRIGKTACGASCAAKYARFGLPENDMKPAIGSQTVVYDSAASLMRMSRELKHNKALATLSRLEAMRPIIVAYLQAS